MPASPANSPSTSDLAAQLATVIPLHLLRTPDLLADVASRWCERQRAWHGPQHLLALLRQVEERAASDDRETLQLTALYHDAIYDPRAADNEELESIQPGAGRRYVPEAAEIYAPPA